MPYPMACVGLLLAACPDGGSEDDTTTTMASSTASTDPGPLTDGSDPTASDSSTTGTCTEGTLGCPCSPGNMCAGTLECQAGVCVAPEDDTTTGPDETTTTGPAMCGNGMAEPGDLCLGQADPWTMGTGTIAVTAGHFDGDDTVDLVTANRDANSISIRLGMGDGNFDIQTTFTVGAGPIAVGHGDFDGDTNLDVVTVSPTALEVTVLPGDGNGGFVVPIPTPLAAMLVPTDLAVTDLENDGDPDLLVTESSMSLIHIYRTEMGLFMPAVTVPTGGGPSAIHVADFSGEGVPDAVTSDATANTVSLLLGNGLGGLGEPIDATAGTAPVDVGSGDFNGDGDVDAVVINPDGNVTIRLGTGVGNLGGQQVFNVPGVPAALVSTDLDLDGNTDVAVASGDDMVHILLGNGMGTLSPALDIPVGMQPQDIIAVDLNDDGLLDLVTANLGANTVSVILSNA